MKNLSLCAADPSAADEWLEWEDGKGGRVRRKWRSAGGALPPKRWRVADDTMPADTAYRLASEGNGLIWQGDFQNARLLLQAIARRIDRKPAKKVLDDAAAGTDAFNRYRQLQAQRARTLGMLLVPLEGDYSIGLRRAPDVREACAAAYGEPDGEPAVISLRELQGLVGAFEWRKKGLDVPAAGGRIHPHYGVFAPIRGEYLDLVAGTPMPAGVKTAFDLGTGTGVLAAILAQRGVPHIVATDIDPRALVCAKENLDRLGIADRVELHEADLFPQGKAQLILCNPPWLPARPGTALDRAVYDPDSGMLRGFLNGLAAHLAPGGEGWLILSDLAVHLGLRSTDEIKGWMADAGLRVLGKHDVRPAHPKISDPSNPLHAARAKELTSLWRLGV